MIKIRSTEKLATSNSDGLCDMLREMSSFNFNIETLTFTTIVKDSLFQEKEIETQVTDDEGNTIDKTIVERKVIEERQAIAYKYTVDSIEEFYQLLGQTISKSTGFSNGLIANLTVVLIAQTGQYKRQTMTNWIVDTDHTIVKEFSV